MALMLINDVMRTKNLDFQIFPLPPHLYECQSEPPQKVGRHL